MLAIYKKELRSYFTSMIGYVFIALFLVVIGIYFTATNLQPTGYANFEYVLSSVSFLFFILVPVLTMRLMAEEKKQKTDQLLLTSPISVEKIIFGKYLAVATVFLMSIAVIMFYPLILTKYGTVDLGTTYSAVLGFALMGLAFLALGFFISTCTENQMVAAVVSFVVILVVFLMSGLVGFLPTDNRSAVVILSVAQVALCILAYFMMRNITVSILAAVVVEAVLVLLYMNIPAFYDGIIVKITNWLSVSSRFDSFMRGTLDLTAVIYLISFAFLFLFLSIQSVKKRRWR